MQGSYPLPPSGMPGVPHPGPLWVGAWTSPAYPPPIIAGVAFGSGKKGKGKGSSPRSAPMARVSSGWLDSPYGERASVSIVRQPTSLAVWHGEVGRDRASNRTTVYEGRSVVEATKCANQLMHVLRLRGFRASQPGSVDRDFGVGEVSRRLNVAIDQ